MSPPPTSSVATIETTQSHHTDILEKLRTPKNLKNSLAVAGMSLRDCHNT
uniref:Uncharacterized protein n=1 Tax=Moniliophthora roreri TaxID=221103 RepID=A0A0W0FCA3_MONRR